MVAASLPAMAYRQYDYDVTMGYRCSLARWLHKHLALVFLNAGMMQTYTIPLSSLRENSGLLNRATLRHQARAVESALRELMESASTVLRSFDREDQKSGTRMTDIRYSLYPSAEMEKSRFRCAPCISLISLPFFPLFLLGGSDLSSAAGPCRIVTGQINVIG